MKRIVIGILLSVVAFMGCFDYITGLDEEIAIGEGDCWLSLGEMPSAYSWFAAALIDDKIYMSYFNDYRIYDIRNKSWESKTNTITNRYRVSGTSLGGLFYIFGGYSHPNYFSQMDSYNPATDTWSETGGVISPSRYGSTASTVDNKIYIMGGGTTTVFYNTNQCFTPPASWTTPQVIPTGLRCHAAGVIGKKIYLFGGQKTGSVYNEKLYIYDTEDDTWSTGADMPTLRDELGGAVVNGKLYAIGGYLGGAKATAVVEEYDPATDTWTRRADMPTARCGLQAIAYNGKIYAIGGSLNGYWEKISKIVEVYIPPQ